MVKDVYNNQASKRIGIILSLVQLVMSVVLMVSLVTVNMLPMKYIAIVGILLIILFVLTLAGQMVSKKKALFGKIFSVLLSIIIGIVAFYLFKMHGTMQGISSDGNKKVDQIVVAVLADDPAETIEDAKYYSFGVQHILKGEEIDAVIEDINKTLDYVIWTEDYRGVVEQATALKNKEVQAIIYNTAYVDIISEEIENFEESIKIIYTHEIESDMTDIVTNHESVLDEPFAVYISGIDRYGKISLTSRSDVNIIAVVNPNTHQILLVTTPRDMYVPIPGVSNGVRDKLTHAGLYGVDASMAALGELYDMELDYYFRVNFTSMEKMVDALGGITVYSNQAFETVIGDYWIEKGYNKLNGKQALAFARERKHIASGDNQRGKNQQEVIKAMLKKILSPAILSAANDIFESVKGNVETNMSINQIQTLIKEQLNTGATWSVASMAAEGVGDKETCYSIPNSYVYVAWPVEESIETIKQAIDDVLEGNILEDAEQIMQ